MNEMLLTCVYGYSGYSGHTVGLRVVCLFQTGSPEASLRQEIFLTTGCVTSRDCNF